MSASPDSHKSATSLARRALLKRLLAAWAATCVLPWQLTFADNEPSTDRQPTWLLRITGQPDAVLRLGRAYLDAHTSERDRDHLLALVEQALNGQQGQDSGPPENSSQMITALKRLVADEYVRDQVTLLQGWVVSHTEARLYALAAIFYGV